MNNTPDQSPLGKTSAYQTEYAPELLFPIPRQQKRDELGLQGTLPFFGVDIWNAYELSWLNMRGKPQVAIATITAPADSPNIVESKSFKLYLNSLNQSLYASAADVEAVLARDLSACAGAPVRVRVRSLDEVAAEGVATLPGRCLDDLEIELDQAQRAIKSLVAEQERLPKEMAVYQARNEAIPTRETELTELLRNYSTIESHYRDLLRDREDARIAADLETRQMSERFKVVDAARVPQRAFSPNRVRLNVMGLAAGLEVMGVAFEPVLLAIGRAATALRIRVASVVALFAAMAVLMPAYGATGAAGATLVGSAVALILFGRVGYRLARAR